MPSKEINLLSYKRKRSPEEELLRRRLQRFPPIILGVYVVILASVLVFLFFENQRLATLQTQISQIKTQIEGLKRNEGMYLILKQKSVALQNIITTRFDYGKLYDFFKGLEDEGTKLSEFTFSENGDGIIKVRFKDSATVDRFITALTSEKETRFSHVELSSVTVNKVGTFEVSFTIRTGGKST